MPPLNTPAKTPAKPVGSAASATTTASTSAAAPLFLAGEDTKVTLLYGATDTGKTTALSDVARWMHKKYGYTTRLITADSGFDAFHDIIQSEDNPSGYVDVLRIDRTPYPWAMFQALFQGLWPKEKNGKVVMSAERPENLGLYLWEGLTTFGELLLTDHAVKGRKLTEEVAARWQEILVDEEGRQVQYSSGHPGRSHYQGVQRFLMGTLVPKCRMLPVPYCYITAHEAKGRDDIAAGKSALGPATVGQAGVDKTTQLFPEAFHFYLEWGPKKELMRYANFQSHQDPDTLMNWPAKLSYNKLVTEKALQKWPGGKLPLTCSQGFEQWLEWKQSQGLLP